MKGFPRYRRIRKRTQQAVCVSVCVCLCASVSLCLCPSEGVHNILTHCTFQDFEKKKDEDANRVDNVVHSGRLLIQQGIIPSDKKEKVQFDLDRIPKVWDGIVQKAEDSKQK